MAPAKFVSAYSFSGFLNFSPKVGLVRRGTLFAGAVRPGAALIVWRVRKLYTRDVVENSQPRNTACRWGNPCAWRRVGEEAAGPRPPGRLTRGQLIMTNGQNVTRPARVALHRCFSRADESTQEKAHILYCHIITPESMRRLVRSRLKI